MFIDILSFIISILSSTIGSITGIGGGVIIKPVLDMTGLLSVSVISFLSGCTVLTMSTVSLIRSRKTDIKLDFKISTFLAIGSALGGVLGKNIFEKTKVILGNDNLVGAVQALLLIIMTVGVFIYVIKKEAVKSYRITNFALCFIIGLTLGLLSSFLGIGGGPINLAVLYLLFSMDVKTAAKNSLYIIFFSQLTSLISSFVTNSIPNFNITTLVLMCVGGVSGALIGSYITSKLNSKGVQKAFLILMIIIIMINIYNLVKFLII